jgi:hypothetical protein
VDLSERALRGAAANRPRHRITTRYCNQRIDAVTTSIATVAAEAYP